MRNLRRLLKFALMETLLIASVSLGLAYLLLALVALFLSDRMIFPAPSSSYAPSSQIIQIPTASGRLISTVYLPNNESRYIILYSHGNGEDLGHIMDRLRDLHRFGFAVFAYDYPGYGTSEGAPSEKSAIEAIDAVYEFMIDDLAIPPASIIAYGRSLGGGPTLDLAARKKLGGVILESTFVSAFRVITRIPLLPWDKFRNLARIESVKVPILVMHGTDDEVIPFWHGQALLDRANSPKLYLWVQGSGHNNLLDAAGPTYWDTLEAFRDELDKYR